jgi:CBS domain containing-hemolysin-like protein
MLVMLFNTLFVGTATAWAWTRVGGRVPESLTSVLLHCLVLGLLLMLIRVALPWTASRLGSAALLDGSWSLWKSLSLLAEPVVVLAHGIDVVLHRLIGRPIPSIDADTLQQEIRSIVSEGHFEGLLEDDARDMIEGVIELGDAVVTEIMTPRTDMHMIPSTYTWDELLADVIECGHTRIPVYQETRDEIIGMLYSKDLLPELCKPVDQRAEWTSILRKTLFVPEFKKVDDLLQTLQQSRTHIAIVIDEYGGVAGLITIEDVLEEIVGEIVDEYDEDVEADILPLGDDTCEALGRAHVDEINEALSIDLPEEEDYDTIGGLVFSEFGRVPVEGEVLLWNDSVRITVLEATRRTIERVRVEKLVTGALESA